MYTSTRKKVNITASRAIIEGIGPDGGLYLTEEVDSSYFSKKLIDYSYKELTIDLFSHFLDDYSITEIIDIVNQAYNKENFIPEPVKINAFETFAFLELFHGKTFAFKDMALSVLPLLFETAKKINNIKKKTIILTATSGDTGSAALSGFKDLENTFVIVLYPKKGISKFQELQMHMLANDNCYLVPVEGNFDDCQNLVKEIFTSVETNNSILSSANSINIGRIIPQIVYYIYSYLELCRYKKIKFGEEINITVPTGNFGNIYAGSIAKRLGLPIKKLIIASNVNNVLTDLFNDYTYNIDRDFVKTISPSMDILISSNFERYLYDILQDPSKVKTYMKNLSERKYIQIDELKKEKIFYALYSTEEDTLKAIKEVYKEYNYLIDPHTAVAYSCSQKYLAASNDKTYMLILSTASPFKFSRAVIDALEGKQFVALREEIEYLKTFSTDIYDLRIDDVLDTSVSLEKYSLQQAREFIKKVIGEIDASN